MEFLIISLLHVYCCAESAGERILKLVNIWQKNSKKSIMFLTHSVVSVSASSCVVMMLGSGRPHTLTISQAFSTTFIKSTAFLLQWFLLLTSVTTTETANWTSGDDWESIEETPTGTISTPWRMRSTRGWQHKCKCICAHLSPDTVVVGSVRFTWNKKLVILDLRGPFDK